MGTAHNAMKLSSVEYASLWNCYIFETMVHHICCYFSQHTDDQDIKEYVDHVIEKTKANVEDYVSFFKTEKIPTPRGTTSDDINLNAPRLFTDVFYINYLKNMAKFALMQFAIIYSECAREDIRKMFLSHLKTLEDVDQKGTEIMLSKGLFHRSPSIPYPKEVNFVSKKNILNGFFSHKRPLSVLEIGALWYNAKYNALGKALMTGFSQVATSEGLRHHFLKGKEMANKYYQLFSKMLNEEEITVPTSFDSEVLDPTESPFSDRFMINHVTLLNSFGLSTYGMALSQSQRVDLVTTYTRVMAEVLSYGNECADHQIQNAWFEEPPLIPNRDELANSPRQ